MTIAASKPAHESLTSDKMNALGGWLATIIVWFAGAAMLLAIVAVLLGPAE